jgi:hypothetical protein
LTQTRAQIESIRHAKIARHIGAWIQPVSVVAVFVLWLIRGWPFLDAVEVCIVTGICIYSALNVYAAIICAWGGDGHVLAARVSRLIGVILYLIMRYALHYGFWKSVGVWLALWIVAWWIGHRSRRSAIAGAPVKLKLKDAKHVKSANSETTSEK